MTKKNGRPFVSIVINNFNGEKFLKTCLSSVFKTDYSHFEVIVVDDRSQDKSLKLIKKHFGKQKNLKVHKMTENSGTAATRNKGAQLAKGDVVVFLDNDTEVTRGWLKELTKTLFSQKNIGISQSLLLDFKKRNLIQMAGGRLIPQVAWLAPFNQWDKHDEVKDGLTERSILGITAALAVRKEVFEKIGYFDEKLVAYVSDIEFSWRAWIAGYKVVLSPKSIVYHHTKSMKQRSHMYETKVNAYFHLSKNSIRTIIKNYEARNVFKYLPYSILINLGRSLAFLITRLDTPALVGTTKGFAWNVVNFADTLNERKRVQKTRKVNDDYLRGRAMTEENITKIYSKYFK